MTYSLTWLPAVLRAAGLTVVEVPGWPTRGHGDVGRTQMVLCHHTAEACHDHHLDPALSVLLNGRPDLAGPLCNLALGEDGKFYMVAAGKAWHAGAGFWHGVTDGNGHGIGIEAKNNGIDEPWPEIQVEAYAKGCAAIARHCGFGPEMIAGHKEYALPRGRKTDPDFDMVAFRVRVSKFMYPVPAPGKAPAAPSIKKALTPTLAAKPSAIDPRPVGNRLIGDLNMNGSKTYALAGILGGGIISAILTNALPLLPGLGGLLVPLILAALRHGLSTSVASIIDTLVGALDSNQNAVVATIATTVDKAIKEALAEQAAAAAAASAAALPKAA